MLTLSKSVVHSDTKTQTKVYSLRAILSNCQLVKIKWNIYTIILIIVQINSDTIYLSS